MEIDRAKIERAVRMIIEAIGEDVNREGLKDTPVRVAEMYEEIFSGLREDVAEHFSVTFSEDSEDLVIVKDISFFSMCEHHFVPFFGKIHVGYIPDKGKVIGLSKVVRVIECITRRLQIQERITSGIANVMMEELQPSGIIVIVEAEHMCMEMRGVRSVGSKAVTSAVRGCFLEKKEAQTEVFKLMGVT